MLVLLLAAAMPGAEKEAGGLFARENLVAWCIVPFDSRARGPEERAEMMRRLGFTHFAYDWRAEHLPTYEAELDILRNYGIELTALWFPGALNDEARTLLAGIEKRGLHPQLWVTSGAGSVEQARAEIEPIAREAKRLGCKVALYNHGGWFGEPENQLQVIRALGMDNVGIVYNLHHGHAHLDRFEKMLGEMLPHLLCLNLNGMVRDGEAKGQKILPLGQGDKDLRLLRIIRDSGYKGPIGIIGHTMDDVELRLRDNLDGLDWLVPQLDGGPAPGPKPAPRTMGGTAALERDAWEIESASAREAMPERWVIHAAPVGELAPAAPAQKKTAGTGTVPTATMPRRAFPRLIKSTAPTSRA